MVALAPGTKNGADEINCPPVTVIATAPVVELIPLADKVLDEVQPLTVRAGIA